MVEARPVQPLDFTEDQDLTMIFLKVFDSFH
jgi:hypothetical protein